MKMLPELEKLVQQGKHSDNANQVAAAENLEKNIEEILNSPNHRWYLNNMSPAEKLERQQRQEDFRQRYSD